MKKAVVFTLGCKVNSYESQSIMHSLKERGFEVFDKLQPADLFIINTCAVTAEAEKKSRQAIARARKFNKNCKIIVTGCASQHAPQDFLSKDNVTLVTGARRKSSLLKLLDQSASGNAIEDTQEYDNLAPYKSNKERQFIKIQDGCNNYCSYCIIPYLRGSEKSRDWQSIVQEVNSSTAKEVILTGINISSYNYEGVDIARLLNMLSDADKRIRLGSLENGIISQSLILAAKSVKNFAPHFHLSLQSGSDKVLKDMNRKYLAGEFLQKTQLIYKHFPRAAITSDVIVGFPTESYDDFLQTLSVCRQAKFADIHCFAYSKRQGTAAAKYSELAQEVKTQRLNQLLALKAELKDDFLNKNLNTTLFVVFEEYSNGISQGYSQNYIRVYARGNHLGTKQVVSQKLYLDGLLAEII